MRIYFILFIFCLLWLEQAQAEINEPASAPHSMVVSSQHLATQVGLDILQKHGNAIDAAIAMGYALAVVHPCCGNIGGGGFMLVHTAGGKNLVINFREKAPHAIRISDFWDEQGQVIKQHLSGGYEQGRMSAPFLAVGVPGTVLGLEVAHQLLGTVSLKTLIQPAIELAERGYILQDGDIAILNRIAKDLAFWPNVRDIFLPHDQLWQSGQKLVQKNLAHTLKRIQTYGSSEFYRGHLANEWIHDIQKQGGLISKDDLMHYSVEIQKPLVCQYRGYQVVTLPPPASGVTVCQILAMANAFPISQYGFHSAKTMKLMSVIMATAFAERAHYLGDPRFTKINTDELLSEDHLAKLHEKVLNSLAGHSQHLAFIKSANEGNHTTAYLVADSKGNVVAVTYTLNDYFGVRAIPGNTGFFLNNELADFVVPNKGEVTQSPNVMAPDKVPASSISPVFIMKNGRVHYAFATPGGKTIITQIVEAIQNVIDFHQNIQQAVNEPRYHVELDAKKIYFEQGALTDEIKNKLVNAGYVLKLGSPWGATEWGALTALDLTHEAKLGAMDKRRPAGLAKVGEKIIFHLYLNQ